MEPPPLEDSRLCFFGAHGGVYESPPNTPPPLIEATYEPVYSMMLSHGHLPQLDTSSRSASSTSEPSSPEGYWQEQNNGPGSPMSESYGAVCAYQSPVATQSHYAQSFATSSALSPVVDTCYTSSLSASTSYSSPASAEGYPAYEPQQIEHVPHWQPHVSPHVPAAPYIHRHASHSPASVAVSRSLTTRRSVAHIAAHSHAQPDQQQHPAHKQLHQQQQPHHQLYMPQANSTSPPPSSHQSPQTPYSSFREEPPAYAEVESYATAEGMYAVYDAHGQAPYTAPMIAAKRDCSLAPGSVRSLSLRSEKFPRYGYSGPALCPHHPTPQAPRALATQSLAN